MSNFSTPNLSGDCDPAWDGVRQCFEENFRSRGEVGASICVHRDGKTVVDLGAGWADHGRQVPWTRDTLTVVFSATKAAVALCTHILADRGELDLHAPVSRYWPAFARNGKDGVTVAMLLDHSAGVPGFREPLKQGAYLDWDYVIVRLEAEAPFWEPGTRQGYHLLTFGWTVGEVVRRVSGKSLGGFFRSEIAEPLGLDFWIGLPANEESRVAAMLPPVIDPAVALPPVIQYVMDNPESLVAKAFGNHGGMSLFPESPTERAGIDTPPYHAAEIGAAGGIANARSLAQMYKPLANGGNGLISPGQIHRMSRISTASHRDAFTCIPTRYALGYVGRLDNRHLSNGESLSLIIGDRAFGHPGMGGSVGFADPDCRLSFGYNVNQMGMSAITDARAQALIDAAYRCAGVDGL